MTTTQHPSPEQRARNILDPALANRDRLDFVLALSHELRTPVGIITGYVSLAREGQVSADEALDVVALHASELASLLELLLQAANRAGTDRTEEWDAPLRDALANAARAKAAVGSVVDRTRRGRRRSTARLAPSVERRDATARTARDELASLVSLHPRDVGSLPLAVVARLLEALADRSRGTLGA